MGLRDSLPFFPEGLEHLYGVLHAKPPVARRSTDRWLASGLARRLGRFVPFLLDDVKSLPRERFPASACVLIAGCVCHLERILRGLREIGRQAEFFDRQVIRV